MEKNFNSKGTKAPKKWDIWMCTLPDKGENVQRGNRPVLVCSNDRNNYHSPTINVIPLTGAKKKNLPIHVLLWRHQKYGLPDETTVLCEQITTIQKDSLEKYTGHISDASTRSAIAHAIEIQLSLYQ